MPRPTYSTPPAQVAGAANCQDLVAALLNAVDFEERGWAARGLAAYDWRSHPGAVQALMTAARNDPAPMVRSEAVHALGRMDANTVAVLNLLRVLQRDPDARVRLAVDAELARLGGHAKGVVQPPELAQPLAARGLQ
jgi:hypothetical protein